MQEGNSFTELLKNTVKQSLTEYSKPIENLQYLTVTHVSQCLRRSWYKLKKGGLDLASEYADMGIILHQLIENTLKDKTELGKCYTEVDIAQRFYGIEIRGRIDALCISGDAYRIIEFKTTSLLGGFRGIENSHLMQISLYWHLTGTQKLRKEAYIVYVDRKTGDTKVIDMTHSHMLRKKELGKRIKTLVKHFHENKEPKPEPSRACTFCPYKQGCKGWRRLQH